MCVPKSIILVYAIIGATGRCWYIHKPRLKVSGFASGETVEKRKERHSMSFQTESREPHHESSPDNFGVSGSDII